MNEMEETVGVKSMWLGAGQFWCDAHRMERKTMPFFFAPRDAVCAECTDNALESYLTRRDHKRTE